MIQKFRNKQFEIEAIQFNGNSNKQEVEKFLGKEIKSELESETAYVAGVAPPIFSLLFETTQGVVKVFRGEWIIKELLSGNVIHFHSLKNDIFKKTYELVNDNKIGVYSPLCVGELSELREILYQEQFLDYDETVNANKVLDELQNLNNNPKLLDYVIKCLANQKIATVPDKFYCVVVNAEKRMEYNEKIHGTLDDYKRFCIDGDYGLKKRDHLLAKVYQSVDGIEDEIMKSEGEEIVGFGHTKHQKYSIHEIG